jgi:hypothetical protein
VLLLFGQDVAHARVGTRSSSLASTSRSVSRGGRFSGVHQWPVLGVHRGLLVKNATNSIVLDGQQRLATATILLSVVRDFLTEYRNDAAVRTSQRYIMDFDDATGANSYKLTLNRYDRDFFRREVQEVPAAGAVPPTPTLASHRLIQKARAFFRDRFEDNYQGLGRGKDGFDWAVRVQNVLVNHMSVVVVESTDEDNAASVFETLNDRGIGLSTPDLLRNLLLRRAQNEPDREEIIRAWEDVLEVGDAASVDDFLRHYWISQNGDIKTRSLYREIKTSIESNDAPSLRFSRDLQQAAEVYRDITASRDDDADLQRLLQDINALGARALLPAVLSAYAVGDLNQKRKFLKALLVVYVRHALIGNLENSRLESVVFSTARQLREDGNFAAAVDRLRTLAPADASFTERFQTVQVRRGASARYLLRELEHHRRQTQEVAVELPDRVHVEHIYPQRPLDGQKVANHDAIINRLGNLTLLGRRSNEAIRNGDFASKLPSYQLSDILLTRELTTRDSWNETAINERQIEMSAAAADIWAFPAM